MNRFLASIAAMLMMCWLAQTANAATVVQSYRFLVEAEGPIASFGGTTTLEIYTDDTLSRVLGFDLTVGDHVFTAADVAIQTVFGGRAIVIQSVTDGVTGPFPGVDAFVLAFVRDQPGGAFGYTLASEPENEEGHGFKSVTVDLVTDAVPEPATWAMLIVGLAAVGAALRCRPLRMTVSG